MTEIGSARLGMIVADELRRNRKITSDDEEQREHERELHVVDRRLDRLPSGRRGRSARTAGGISLWSFSSDAFTRSATSTVFVPGCRWIASMIARVPLYQLAVLLFCTSSVIAPDLAEVHRRAVAIRDDHVAELLRVLELAGRLHRERRSSGPYSTPVGRLTFCCVIAVGDFVEPIPRVASALGSSCTRTAYFCEPYTMHLRHAADHRQALRDRRLADTRRAVDSGISVDVSASVRIGASAGFVF